LGIFWSAGADPTRSFICDDAQPVTAFATQTMHQAPSFLVGQTALFTAALADYRPSSFF
jgi:hypothetical protein